MRLIALDTSARVLGVAAVEDGRIRRWEEHAGELRHTEGAAPAIARMLDSLEWSADSLAGIAVAGGPGSFTGLRIGMALAKGIAEGGVARVVAVPTLEALAVTELLLAHASEAREGLIVATLDARAGKLYAAIFRTAATVAADGPHPRPSLTRCTDDLDVEPIRLAEIIAERQSHERVWITGAGMDAAIEGLAQAVSQESALADADIAPGAVGLENSAVLGVALEGWRLAQEGRWLADDAGPTYLRDGDVGRGGGIPRFRPPGDLIPGAE